MPSDAPTTSVTHETVAPAAAVWQVIIDPRHPIATSPELVDAEWIDDGPALGARFRGDNQRGDWRWSTTSTVTTYEPPHRFGWTVNDLDDPVSSWTYELDETADGTRITYTCRIGPGPSGLTAAYERNPDRVDDILARRLAGLREAMAAAVADVAARAEAG